MPLLLFYVGLVTQSDSYNSIRAACMLSDKVIMGTSESRLCRLILECCLGSWVDLDEK